jgi:hypothetical protein
MTVSQLLVNFMAEELVWTFWRRLDSLVPAGIRTPSRYTGHYLTELSPLHTT